MDEKKLVELARKGDSGAFMLLYGNCEKKLLKVARILSPGDEQDILQETAAAAYACMGKFRGKASFYTWIYRILINISYSRFRRRRRHAAFMHALNRNSAPVIHDSPETEDSAVRETVRKGLQGLLPKYQEVLTLYYFEELSVGEISRAIGKNEGTVKSRLFHARMKLKKLIEPEMNRLKLKYTGAENEKTG